jgi:uncharacterized membrane protein
MRCVIAHCRLPSRALRGADMRLLKLGEDDVDIASITRRIRLRVVTLLALWLHLLGVVVWLGGVLYQAHILMPMARRTSAATFADAARRQRPVGWAALALVVLTGFYNVTQLGPVERVMGSGAGLLLAGKFILVLIVVAVAGQRDFTQFVRLQLALQTNDDTSPSLRAIAWLDRITIVLAVIIMYLGLAASRS